MTTYASTYFLFAMFKRFKRQAIEEYLSYYFEFAPTPSFLVMFYAGIIRLNEIESAVRKSCIQADIVHNTHVIPNTANSAGNG